MSSIDKHRIASRNSDDEIEVFGLSAEELLQKTEQGVSEGAKLLRKVTGKDDQQRYSQYQQPYYPYQQPKKGMPDWAVYSLGAVGVLGLGFVGYKIIKG